MFERGGGVPHTCARHRYRQGTARQPQGRLLLLHRPHLVRERSCCRYGRPGQCAAQVPRDSTQGRSGLHGDTGDEDRYPPDQLGCISAPRAVGSSASPRMSNPGAAWSTWLSDRGARDWEALPYSLPTENRRWSVWRRWRITSLPSSRERSAL